MPKIAISFICLLISLALIFVLVLPKKEALDFSQKRVEEKKAEIQRKEEYFLNLKNLLDELKNYQTQLSKIDSTLPETPGLPLLFDFLQKSAGQAGLVLSSIKASASAQAVLKKESQEAREEFQEMKGEAVKKTKEEAFRETKIDLTLSGSYPAFKNFLSILEKSARLIETESITFSTPKEEAFQFDLKIKIHSY